MAKFPWEFLSKHVLLTGSHSTIIMFLIQREFLLAKCIILIIPKRLISKPRIKMTDILNTTGALVVMAV